MPDEALDEQELRQQLVGGAYQLWARGVISGDNGLVSVKVNRRRYLVTPPGKRRGALQPADVLPVDMGGMALDLGRDLPDHVWNPHRLAYQSDRSGMGASFTDQHEVKATVLAVPPHTAALLRLRKLDESLQLPDVTPVPILKADDEAGVRRAFEKLPAVWLDRRGLLTAGTSLDEAVAVCERIEHAATIEVLCLRG